MRVMTKRIRRRKPGKAARAAASVGDRNGWLIDFRRDTATTIEEVFGPEPIGPVEMTKRLWIHIRDNNLATRVAGSLVRLDGSARVRHDRPNQRQSGGSGRHLDEDELSDDEVAVLVDEEARARGHQLTENRRKALVLSRRGQGQFRSDLIKLWRRCAVTGCCETRLLRASHLKPWNPSNHKERLDPFNGLLLAPHLDALLDCGLITFGDDGRILVSARLASDDGECLGIRSTMKLRTVHRRHIPYLKLHRSIVFQK